MLNSLDDMMKNESPINKFVFMLLERIEHLEDKVNKLEKLEEELKIIYIKIIIKDYKNNNKNLVDDIDYYGTHLFHQLLYFLNYKEISYEPVEEKEILTYAKHFFLNNIKEYTSLYKIIEIFYRLNYKNIKEFHSFDEIPDEMPDLLKT
jgi:hypothetical protein